MSIIGSMKGKKWWNNTKIVYYEPKIGNLIQSLHMEFMILAESLNNNSGSIMEPIYMSPAQAYHDSGEMEAALSYQMPTWCYTRIANPSNFYLGVNYCTIGKLWY